MWYNNKTTFAVEYFPCYVTRWSSMESTSLEVTRKYSTTVWFCFRAHRLLLDSRHKGPLMRIFDISFAVHFYRLLNKRAVCWFWDTVTIVRRCCDRTIEKRRLHQGGNSLSRYYAYALTHFEVINTSGRGVARLNNATHNAFLPVNYRKVY